MGTQIQKSLFNIPGMDCAAEENLVRMRLGDMGRVKTLEFDLPAKEVTVYHDAAVHEIEAALASLDLGASHLRSENVEEAISDAGMQSEFFGPYC